MALLTMRFAGKFLAAQMCLTRRQRDCCPCRKQRDGSQRCPPDRGHILSAVQRLHDADHRARRNATPCRESHSLPERSKQWRCPLCQRLFQLYKKGPRGWNTKPYTLCIECYRTQKRRRRHLAPKVGPSPPEPGLQTLEVTSPAPSVVFGMNKSQASLEAQAKAKQVQHASLCST